MKYGIDLIINEKKLHAHFLMGILTSPYTGEKMDMTFLVKCTEKKPVCEFLIYSTKEDVSPCDVLVIKRYAKTKLSKEKRKYEYKKGYILRAHYRFIYDKKDDKVLPQSLYGDSCSMEYIYK